MSAVITHFDTLSYSKDLEKVGFTAEQAALLARTQLYALDHAIADKDLATKKDLIELKTELKEEITSLRSEYKESNARLRDELKEEITNLRSEYKESNARLHDELKEDIAGLHTEMIKYSEKSHAEMTNTFRWTLGFMIALATIIVTLFLAK